MAITIRWKPWSRCSGIDDHDALETVITIEANAQPIAKKILATILRLRAISIIFWNTNCGPVASLGSLQKASRPTAGFRPNCETRFLERAIFSGVPVVRVGRGNPEGFSDLDPIFISGSNLNAIKARILLMAALMKLGSLPSASDPAQPTAAEIAATRKAVATYQQIFNTH
jgi:hypothetical protein